MDASLLPMGDCPSPEPLPHFPTRWQAVLWRNRGMVPPERLAAVLKTSVDELREAAEMLGLPSDLETDPAWIRRGYLTIIRNNWHLLSYEQLLDLLSWTPERLAHSLREEDFLWLKLGRGKPVCPPVCWTRLTEEEKKKTQLIRSRLERHFPAGIPKRKEKVFSFLHDILVLTPVVSRENFSFNFIAPYSATCGDIFCDDDPLPDVLLERYAAMGIQGIWIHAVLYLLVPIPGAEEFSVGWRERRIKYGLKIYLYLNEPRALPLPFFERKPDWAGLDLPLLNTKTICTARSPEPLQWLEFAMHEVWDAVPYLGGAFCITMSENPTNCHYRAHSYECPFCKNILPAQIIADVLSAMERGMHAVAPESRLIASTWGWQRVDRCSPDIPDDVEFSGEIMSRLSKSIHIAAVSENSLNLHIGGVNSRLGDYSISQVGPSEKSQAVWRKAREYHLSVVAKVQLNNSWELAAVPWLPVPNLVQEHLQNLKREGISGLMLSWTHGGYPGGNLELLRATPEEIAATRFSAKNAEKVCRAWRQFSDAFRQFPFCKELLYLGPTNRGPGNRFYLKPTHRHATMLWFPYDNLKAWRGLYPETVFERQFSLLLEKWEDGINTLGEVSPQTAVEKTNFEELKRISAAAECHFRSTFRQIKFIRAREQNDYSEMKQLLADEIITVKKLLSLVCCDSKLGFEASNHYFYSVNDLLEKLLSCEHLLKEIALF